MEEKKSKLEIRKAIKKRKPTYKRIQSNQFAKFKNDEKWRRPKGMGNKDRRNRKGHIGMLKVGYGSPNEVKGANRSGMFEVIVCNVKDLDLVDTKTQVAVISRTVGAKKKVEILKAAMSKKIVVSNVKDSAAKISEIEHNMKVSKENKAIKKVKKSNRAAKEDTKSKETKNTADVTDTAVDKKSIENKDSKSKATKKEGAKK